MTTRETSSRPAAMASSAVNLEDVLSEEFLTEPAIGPPSEEFRARAAAQENQQHQQQREPIPTLSQETRDRLQKEHERSNQSLVAASTTSQHTTRSFGSTTAADGANLSASQHQQARYAAVAQMLGDDDILTTTGDFSSIGGGDATTSTATAAGALSVSQRTTESEETVRARYQAAALVMEETFDQAQEDQIAKDRARLVRGSTSVSNNSGLSVSSFHDDLIEDKYSSVRLASSPQSAVAQSPPNDTKVSFRSGLSSSSTHTQNALSSSSHHSSARRSRHTNTAAGLGSSSHHSSSRREDLAAKDRGRRIPSIQRGSNNDTVAGMNTIGTASTNNLDTTTTTSSSSSSAVTTIGLSQVTPGALAVADGRAQQLAKATISRAPFEPSREFTVPVRPMAPQSSSSTPYTVSSHTSTILPTSSNAQQQQRHPPFSFSHDDAEDAMEAVPSEAGNSKMDAPSSSRKRLCLWLGLGLLVVLVAGIVGAVVAASGGDDKDGSPATTQQSRPIDHPTMAPVVLVESQILQDIRAFLSERGISTETQLLDSSSPQYQALAWVADISSEEWGVLSEEEEQDVLARYALAVFYYTLGGPNWVTEISNQQPNGASWLENRGTIDGIQNVCDWQGISCSGGLVESIQFLSSKRLRGDLPTELNVMSSLRSLQIENNEIQGLKGPLTNLRVLSLSGNSLGELNIGIPSAIMEMTNLQSLDLSGNDLVGTLSGDIQNFASLNNLDLSDNRFEGTLSTQFRSMVSLRDLRFSNNNFEGDINVIVENLPSELRALQGGQNHLSGSLTASIVMFSNLARFELPENDLSGAFPNAVFDLSSLAILDLSLNDFTGSLAENVGNPGGELERLRLSGNQLSGSIPTMIGRLVGLYDLFLQRNALNGPIPTELAQCQSLESVLLSSNFLSGPIPSELGTLQNLETLAVEVNELTGSLPSELGQLQKLRDLRVLANLFTGILPSEICALPSLNQVDATAASDIDCGGCSKCV